MVIFRFMGCFGQFLGFEVIWVIFRFQGYFIHFLGLGGISVSGVFQSFFSFRGYFGNF